MNKPVIIILIIVVVAVGGFILFDSLSDDDEVAQQSADAIETNSQAENTPATETPSTEPQEETAELTSAEVANHSSSSDCWTIIDGNVYDITDYVPRHPGGDEILAACGTDGSTLFNSRTTSDGQTVGSGTPHSSSASSQLESFLLGPLAN